MPKVTNNTHSFNSDLPMEQFQKIMDQASSRQTTTNTTSNASLEGLDLVTLESQLGIQVIDAQAEGEAGHGELSIGDRIVGEDGIAGEKLDASYFDRSNPSKLETALSINGNKVEIAVGQDKTYLLVKQAAFFADKPWFKYYMDIPNTTHHHDKTIKNNFKMDKFCPDNEVDQNIFDSLKTPSITTFAPLPEPSVDPMPNVDLIVDFKAGGADETVYDNYDTIKNDYYYPEQNQDITGGTLDEPSKDAALTALEKMELAGKDIKKQGAKIDSDFNNGKVAAEDVAKLAEYLKRYQEEYGKAQAFDIGKFKIKDFILDLSTEPFYQKYDPDLMQELILEMTKQQ